MDPDLAQALRAAVGELHAHTAPVLWDHHGHTVLERVGASLLPVGQAGAAVAHARGLCRESAAHHDPDDFVTGNLRHQLAVLCAQAGDQVGAIAEFEAVRDDQARRHGPDSASVLSTRALIAGLRGQVRDPAGAVADHAALPADYTRLYGPDNVVTRSCRRNLAYWRSVADAT
ncbi:hypothetical protein ABZ816_02730 [Actinosynnema sp. NPDC047251]|uniref:Uncharacterized protein n=1 Tax=Saccharothrix espanaensis (strain ATCC 51144 / DSM 44229 / JCM 9112 / NBRC 15066 / NRRL 15764) TaxID=1179773 RepID=K0K3R5_SACES|nr:hypothetical protein [Saccharothrix espanaensis]CCH31168.1 hypothetical protein BN6_38790 [Saccharothrix espanaensis DSM 44229]